MTFTDNVSNFLSFHIRGNGARHSVNYSYESNGSEESVCFSYGNDSDFGGYFGFDEDSDFAFNGLFDDSYEMCNRDNDFFGDNRFANSNGSDCGVDSLVNNILGSVGNLLGGLFGLNNEGPQGQKRQGSGGTGTANGSGKSSPDNGCGCPGSSLASENRGSGRGPGSPSPDQGAGGANGETKGIDSYIKGGSGNVDSYNVSGLGQNKQKIVAAAKQCGASENETAALLAIANQETEKMDSNYKHGDGKSGGSACFTPFKCNASMIKEAAQDGAVDSKYQSNPDSINNNLQDGVKVMTHLMKKYGMKKFIDYLRGGTSGRDGNYPRSKIDDYDQAMHKLISAYANNKELWSNDQRVKSNVKAI